MDAFVVTIVMLVLTYVIGAISKSRTAKTEDGKTTQTKKDPYARVGNPPYFENTTRSIFEKYFEGSHESEQEDEEPSEGLSDDASYKSSFDPHPEPHFMEGQDLSWGSLSRTGGYVADYTERITNDGEETEPQPVLELNLRIDKNAIISGVVMSEILRRPDRRMFRR